jgi:plastocyanin
MTRAVTLVVALAAAALLGAADGAATQAQGTTLTASVGPGFSISLRTAGGAAVTRLTPGTYTINVNDQSDFHSFALSGPGVTEDSGVAFTGMVSWTVTLTNGTYTFRCTAHPTTMRGSFTGGSAGPPPVRTITAKTRLVVTSGPTQRITLKTAGGAAVKQMKVGTYNVTVRDRSPIHNVHLRGPGYNRKTTPLTFRGTQKWKVALKRAGTFRFLCDPHASLGMRGSAKVVR